MKKHRAHGEIVLKFGPNFVISHLLLLNSLDLLQILISFHWCHPHEGIVWEKNMKTSPANQQKQTVETTKEQDIPTNPQNRQDNITELRKRMKRSKKISKAIQTTKTIRTI